MTEATETDLDGFDELTLAMRHLLGSSRELTGRMAHVVGKNRNDMEAVGLLLLYGPMGATELARRLGVTTAAATGLIDRLERDGRAERVRDTGDRRRVVVTETAQARADNLAAWLPVIDEMDDVSRAVPGPDREAVLHFLHQMTAALDRSGHHASPRRGRAGSAAPPHIVPG